jgi:HK97 family phage major capsid protein
MLSSQIDDLVERREQLRLQCERVLYAARAAGRENVLPAEQQMFGDLKTLDDRIEFLRSEHKRGAGSAGLREFRNRINRSSQTRNSTMSTATLAPNADYHLTYRQHDKRGECSWLRDFIRVSTPGMDSTGESRIRLNQHAQEVAQDPLFAEYRDLSRTDGSGGFATPPAWLMNQYIELARPGRAIANLVQRQPLPGGTDSINLPRILTGTAVGIQIADNTSVTDVDLTDTFINAPVRTIAGQQGVAIQLIDQSPIAFDDVVFRDLVAAHAAATDQQVLSGTGSVGQVLGINYTPNISTIVSASGGYQDVYRAIANGIQLMHTTRFLPPEVIVMHPRRWGSLLASFDNDGRPLFIPNAQGPWNAGGILTDVASQQVVGSVQGLPVVTDPNISITSGSEYGTYGDEDAIYILRASDLILWESGIRARVLPEVKAQNLTVLLQVYSYLAFTAARYPSSIVTITGLGTPSF